MMPALPAAADFDEFVNRAVASASLKSRSFADLLRHLPGIGPTDALRALESGSADSNFLRLLADARAPQIPVLPFDQGRNLPLPHPLDMEWRFTPNTVQQLLAEGIAATSDGDAILLLGVPSIAAAAAETTVDRVFLVIGEDNAICVALKQATRGDQRFIHGGGGPQARAAIVDPPWYIDAYVEMLDACARRCAQGALLLLALPPVGVRPTASHDRSLMRQAAIKAGFDPAGEPNTLRYRSPLFELAAWRSAGIGAWLPDWRTGELIRLVKRVEAFRASPPLAFKPPAFELTLDGVRLKLLLGRGGPRSLTPIVEAEVVPSVSARFPGRERAALWTSSNRAYAVDSHIALLAMADVATQRGLMLLGRLNAGENRRGDSTAIDAIRALTHQIDRLASRECAVATELLGETAWLRSVNDARFSGAPWQGFPNFRPGAAA